MSGDAQAAIQELYQLYSDEVYRFARLTIGHHTDALDIVQEVYFRAFRTWGSFQGNANARTWLMSIARNYIYDVFRKKKTERDYLQNYQPPYIPEQSTSIETMMVLEESLVKLKPSYRDVFILRHIHEFSTQETAQILGWSEGKVRTTDYRAAGMLRKLMSPEEKEVAR